MQPEKKNGLWPKRIFSLATLLSWAVGLWAQIQEAIPNNSDPTPVDVQDEGEITLYIVIPIILVIVFFGLRYFTKKRDPQPN